MGFLMNKIQIFTLALFVSFSMLFAQQKLELSYAPEWSQAGLSGTEQSFQRPVLVPQDDKTGKVSVGKAMFFSLLLPGAGEYYVGNTFYAKTFLGIEVAGIVGLFFNNVYHKSLVDDYKSYATLHAGVSTGDKDKQYWVNLGKFDDIYSYNDRRLNQRRINALYDETADNAWQWDSVDNRYFYDFKRIKAAGVKNRNSYFFSALLINHLVSAVNAVRLARAHNRSLARSASKVGVTFLGYRPNDRYFGVALTTQF